MVILGSGCNVDVMGVLWAGERWGEGMRTCRAGIPPKGILLIKEVKSASHCTHEGSTLTRYHCWCGDHNGVCRDPVAPMVVVTLLVCVEIRCWCNTFYARFEWLI